MKKMGKKHSLKWDEKYVWAEDEGGMYHPAYDVASIELNPYDKQAINVHFRQFTAFDNANNTKKQTQK